MALMLADLALCGCAALHLQTMHPIISQQRDQIAQICQRLGIAKLEVFGSAARGIDFDAATSDADFLVEYQPNTVRGLESYVGLKMALEALLKRPVDLVEPARLRNPFVLADINRSRELVYAA